jgi:hypothetical protein
MTAATPATRRAFVGATVATAVAVPALAVGTNRCVEALHREADAIEAETARLNANPDAPASEWGAWSEREMAFFHKAAALPPTPEHAGIKARAFSMGLDGEISYAFEHDGMLTRLAVEALGALAGARS